MITDYDVFKALRTFLMLIFPGIEIVRTQVDNVPMPIGAFIAMNDKGRRRLATNIRTYTDPVTVTGTQNIMAMTESVIQVDFYGAGSAQRCQTFCTLFRDLYAVDNFPSNIWPLFATDPSQTPLIAGEEGFIERWRCEAHIQINPVVNTPMQFFDEGTVTVNAPVNYLEDDNG